MKNLQNLGVALNKAEQQVIKGGKRLFECSGDDDCQGPKQCKTGAHPNSYIVKCYQNACMISMC